MRTFFKILGFCCRIVIACAMILWTFTMNIIGLLIGAITEQ